MSRMDGRDRGPHCGGSGLHSPSWPAEGDKPPLFPGQTCMSGHRLGPGRSGQASGLLRAGQCFGFGKMQGFVHAEGG